MRVLSMRPLLEFLVRVSRNPLVLLISFVSVVYIPSFHFDQKKAMYLYMFIAGVPLIIFLVSFKYLRKDDNGTAGDGSN